MPSLQRDMVQQKTKRKQRIEHFQKAPSGSSLDKPASPLSHEASPHPYHAPSLPVHSRLNHRSFSATSQMSDISMDEFSGNHESVLEYSDTSGEEREDAYFMPDATTGGPRRLLVEDRASSGESAFRALRANGSKSTRAMRFSSDGTPEQNGPPKFGEMSRTNPPKPPAIPYRAQNASHNPDIKTWVANLAYSFRSPQVGVQHKTASSPKGRKHRSQPSSGTMEYPSTTTIPWKPSHDKESALYANSKASLPWESTPLIQQEAKGQEVYGSEPTHHSWGHPLKPSSSRDEERREKANPKPKQVALKSKSTAAVVAACFLMDYEAGRPPSLSPNFETIVLAQLRLYKIHYSWVWRLFGINLAVLVLFLAHSQNRLTTALMHTYAIGFFFMEIWMREQLYGQDPSSDRHHLERRLNRPLILFLLILGLESWVWYIFPPDPNAEVPSLVSSIFKPVVFFYISQKARHALEGLRRIAKIVARVLLIEMFLILAFAAVACQLFRNYESFKNLSSSWISLFELSTTVVNPSLWMPMYETSRSNAIFFILFTIVSVFYLHSLVLSVVFQTYIHAAGEIHDRSVLDREDAVRLAFLALLRDESTDFISASSVRKTLQLVRPHYNVMKIKTLMEIVDPSDQHAIDYPTFRTKIRQALNASIRTARSSSSFAMGIELVAVLVALVNCIYVILLTSDFSAAWFDAIAVAAGATITFLGLFELTVRFNPMRIPNFTPITRLNETFDGLALIGGLVSCAGIIRHIIGIDGSADLILMGRAIDMIRIMRFSQIFRDVVRRSADVFPAMAGPVLLVLTTIHVFVSLGIALWGGAVDPVEFALNESLTPLYYLNNFNSYVEGLVTMFNVLVVNDWHAIAEVFLYAKRCSSPYIVYPFFVATLCCAVFIMLNVVTAFFVESFVTKIEEGVRDFGEEDLQNQSTRASDFSIQTGENTNAKRIYSTKKSAPTVTQNLGEMSEPTEEDPILTAEDHSVQSTNSAELFAFDVYEREGFDQIMRAVAGGASAKEQEAFARSVCDYLEIFEGLAPGREKIGYMLCCQQSMNRFGNRRFENIAKGFLQGTVLHKVVGDMHSELLVLTTRKKFEDRCLVRTIPHTTDPSLKLEITASLLRHQPAVSLLVSRVRPASASDP